MAEELRVEDALQSLTALQQTPLTIIRLSEPISTSPLSSGTHRDSDSDSRHDQQILTPATLDADLNHYKELFSKLRFSYLEQVTKEKFLRGIVGDPPQIVEPRENAELENELVGIKSALKEAKQDVADLVEELEQTARELAGRWSVVELHSAQLRELPDKINELQDQLDDMRRRRREEREKNAREEGADETMGDDLSMNLPLPATQSLVEERKGELDEVNRQLKSLQQALPRQRGALEREERELKVAERERDKAVIAAKEAVQRKEEAGGADEMEVRGRWLNGVQLGLKKFLDVEA